MAYTSINKGSDYFNTVLYSGNGSTQTISGVGFEPDFTWIKTRSAADNHSLQDQVRGANKHLRSDSTLTETESGTVHISSWNSDGFALGSLDGQTNASGRTYVAWNWLASNTTASNTDGSITSTVSANTTSGFSIVSYTGTGANATVGHGLGVTPKMVIAKGRSNTGTWSVYHEGIGNAANGVSLENSSGTRSEPAYWNSTSPTSSVFSVGTSGDTNGSSRTYIAYCFAEKKGFSKFGSYIGNGNANGPMVYTGFKPAMVIIKNLSSATNWQLIDNKRSDAGGFNVIDKVLSPNATDADYDEGSANWFADFVSNGFKIRNGFGASNTSGHNYIYMAFAESPFTTSTGIPTTAR